MAAIAAVDVALWDIKAKAAGHAALPAARRREPRPASWRTATRRARPARAVRLDPPPPGAGLPVHPRADRRAGPRRRSTASRRSRVGGTATTTSPPSAAPLPAEEDWDTRAYLRHIPGVFEAVRNEFGPELPLLHDGHHRMTPIQAARLGKDARAVRPVLAGGLHAGREPGGAAAGPAAHHDAAGHRRGLQHGVGLPDAHPRAAHRLRPRRPSTHTGGISRAAARSSTSPRSTRSSPASTARRTSPRSAWPRRCTSTSPSTTSASRSTCSTAPRTNEVFQQSFTFTDGYLHPGDEAGPGRRATTTRPRTLPVRAGLPAVQPAARTARCTTGDRPPDVASRRGVPAARVAARARRRRAGRRAGRARPSSPRSPRATARFGGTLTTTTDRAVTADDALAQDVVLAIVGSAATVGTRVGRHATPPGHSPRTDPVPAGGAGGGRRRARSSVAGRR